MGRLNQYLFKQATVNTISLIVFACFVLLLERLLRIFQIISNSVNPASDAYAMIVNLLPHYLGIAIPIALMLGITITVDRFSRSSELTAAMGAGLSLTYLTRPFVALALIMVVFNFLVEGYLQPVGRYNYRHVVHLVKQQSFSAVLRQGTFTTVGNRTFYAGADMEKSAVGPIFIYENVTEGSQRGSLRLTTADEGQLIVRDATEEPVLQLSQGTTHQILDNRQLDGEFSFQASSVATRVANNPFRARGDDERELTINELFQNREGQVNSDVAPNVNNASMHIRLAHSVLLLIIPFIAVPFGINYGRNPSSAGIFIGIVFLVALQKLLEFGQSLGANGVVTPWLGIWPIIIFVGMGAFWMYWRCAFKMGQPPLASLTLSFNAMIKNLVQKLESLRRRIRVQI